MLNRCISICRQWGVGTAYVASCPWFWIFTYRNGHVKILWLIDWFDSYTLYPAVLFQMLPELRATLFGTNPNRKHVDWNRRPRMRNRDCCNRTVTNSERSVARCSVISCSRRLWTLRISGRYNKNVAVQCCQCITCILATIDVKKNVFLRFLFRARFYVF